jgi:curved DNA-binding protein CbpA
MLDRFGDDAFVPGLAHAAGHGGGDAVLLQSAPARSERQQPRGTDRSEGVRQTQMWETKDGDAYVVLGVARDADDVTIARAHRRLARRHHPDLAGDAATRQMMRINTAFEAIRTAEARAEYEAARRPPTARDGTGGAGPAPGRPSGSVLDFGRHVGWSIGEIARVDPGYLLWLAERPEGGRYRAEIDGVLARMGIQRNTSHDLATHPWRRGFSGR